jgi:hypothetical protein
MYAYDMFATVSLKRRKQIIMLHLGRMTPLSIDESQSNFIHALPAQGQTDCGKAGSSLLV